MLHYMLTVKLFVQPQLIACREHSQSSTVPLIWVHISQKTRFWLTNHTS